MLEKFPSIYLEELSQRLGQIKTDRRNPELVRSIRPMSTIDSKPNTLSSRFGFNSFPFHTEAAHWRNPARYLLLYCEYEGRGQRPTYLIDSTEWKLTAVELSRIQNDVWQVGLFRPRLDTVGLTFEGTKGIRYDPVCMKPLSKGAAVLQERLESEIKCSSRISVSWKPQQLLIIDNHRMLHARGSSVVADPDRLFKRVLVGGLQ